MTILQRVLTCGVPAELATANNDELRAWLYELIQKGRTAPEHYTGRVFVVRFRVDDQFYEDLRYNAHLSQRSLTSYTADVLSQKV